MFIFYDGKTVRRLGPDTRDHSVVLCKIILMRTWINRSKEMDVGERIRSEVWREGKYKAKYSRCLGSKTEWDKVSYVEHIMKWVDQLVVNSV